MKSRILTPVLLLSVATAVAILLYLNRPPTEMREPEVRVAQVEAARVAKQSLRVPIRAQGTVTPHTETSLVAEVGGRIVDVASAFHAGGFVRAGDVLARIDDRDYKAQLLRAEAAVARAHSALAQEKGRAEVAYNEWKKLPNRSQRSVEANDLYLRKPQLAQAEAELLSAQADLGKARDDLERTVIRAPYDALIRNKRSDLGQFVSPGSPVADVFAIDYAEVRLAVPQSKLAYLDLPGIEGYGDAGAPLVDLFTRTGEEEQHWPATLQRTEGVYDERSRVLFTVARIEDPYGMSSEEAMPIRMGTFVNAVITGRRFDDIVVLPRHILRAGSLIWVIDEDNTLRNRRVSTLRNEGEEIYVQSGLEEGDLVCLTNVSGAINGTPVTVTGEVSTLRLLETPGLEQIGAAVDAGKTSPPDHS